MTRKYFGTDGIRGTVGTLPMTPDFVLKLGHAAGKVFEREGKQARVIIGKDTRVSGYMLEAALESGLIAAGVDVLLAGPIPTPAVAHLTRAFRLDAGIVISASHNPFADNGIKFFGPGGLKLSDAVEQEIEAMLDEPITCVAPKALGKAKRLDDAAGRYIEFCKGSFPQDMNLRGLRIVLDCAHGAAYQTAPAVLHELGAEVITIGNTPDGFNINDNVGAVHPEQLQAAVAHHQADLGIALDGDADRLQMVDANGRLLNGDELLYAVVRDRMRKGPVAGVVGTLMTNYALEAQFAKESVPFVRAKVGDRYVLEQMEERGWLYGGESSGHLIFRDRHTTGDGTIAALQVLAAMVAQGEPLNHIADGLQLYPQVMKNVRMPDGFDWQTHSGLKHARAEVEQELTGRGRVLIRPSGTEPVLRVMVEAQDGDEAKRCNQRLVEAIAS
ncbi:MAG: phosphoglucosamine mutase [Burkholderiaceae bacterium]